MSPEPSDVLAAEELSERILAHPSRRRPAEVRLAQMVLALLAAPRFSPLSCSHEGEWYRDEWDCTWCVDCGRWRDDIMQAAHHPGWFEDDEGYVRAPLSYENREGDPAFNGALDRW